MPGGSLPSAPPEAPPSEPVADLTTPPYQGDLPGAGRIWLHKLGFGYVIAAAHANIDKEFEATADAIERHAERCDFVTRNGLALENRNKDFWNMLIPGVGQQPVYAFVTMITLFVLAIGPVNYFGLLRAKRLSLLVFTVPAGAGLLTLGLFIYAATADGFGVKARIRSITLIDQRSGEAVSAARHSYYAGLAPANGLSFDDQTAVYPIDYDPGDLGSRREVLWREGGVQNLRRGWLPSRSLKQVFAIRPGKTEAMIDVSENGSQITAKNLLGTPIVYVALAASDGELRFAENIHPGDPLTLERVTFLNEKDAADIKKLEQENQLDEARRLRREKELSAIKGVLSKLVEDHRAKFPDNYDPDQHDTMWFGRSNRNMYVYYPQSQVSLPAGTGSSVLEVAIQDATLRSSGLARLRPRTYVAIVEAPPRADNEAPVVPKGTPRPREFGSFHVVQGAW